MSFLRNIVQNRLKQQGIVSLVVVLGVGLFAFGATLTLAIMNTSGLLKTRHVVSGDNMFYGADAASDEGFYQLINNNSYGGGTPELLNGADAGNITVDPNPDWPKFKISGTTENSLTNRITIQEVTVFAEGLAFDYAIFATNFLGATGNAKVIGDVFSNNDITLDGNSLVDGDAGAVGTINVTGSATVTGDTKENLDPIPSPTIVPDDYKALAQSSSCPPLPDCVFSTAADAESYLHNRTLNATVFVEDTAPLNPKNTKLTGTLVTLGDLKLEGGEYKPVPDQVALWGGGDFNLAGNVTIEGLVYIEGKTTFGAGTYKITGIIISKGGVEVSGNTTIEFKGSVIPSDIRDLIGLDPTSAEPPRVLRWDEE